MFAFRTGAAGVARRYGKRDGRRSMPACSPAAGGTRTSPDPGWTCSDRTWPVGSSPVYLHCSPLTWTYCVPASLLYTPSRHTIATHHRVVFADGRRSFMQVVAAGCADAGMDFLDAISGLFPVVAELRLAAHGPLRLAHTDLVPPETVQRAVELTIGEPGETGDTHVDTDRAALWSRLIHFPSGLDEYTPLAASWCFWLQGWIRLVFRTTRDQQ